MIHAFPDEYHQIWGYQNRDALQLIVQSESMLLVVMFHQNLHQLHICIIIIHITLTITLTSNLNSRVASIGLIFKVSSISHSRSVFSSTHTEIFGSFSKTASSALSNEILGTTCTVNKQYLMQCFTHCHDQ